MLYENPMKSVIWIRGCSEKIFGVKSEHPDTADATGLDMEAFIVRIGKYFEGEIGG